MNLSETAFLYPEGAGYRLRWFTPTVEVDLCGHATVASAHVLWESGRAGPGTPHRLPHQERTAVGRAPGRRGSSSTFPPSRWSRWRRHPISSPALGVPARFVGRNQFDYLVEVEGETAVRALPPDPTRLASLPVRGVIVTSRCGRFPMGFRLALLRARLRYRGGSGHRVRRIARWDPSGCRGLGKERAGRLPGLGAGRDRARSRGRRPRAAGWPGGDGPARRTRLRWCRRTGDKEGRNRS